MPQFYVFSQYAIFKCAFLLLVNLGLDYTIFIC